MTAVVAAGVGLEVIVSFGVEEAVDASVAVAVAAGVAVVGAARVGCGLGIAVAVAIVCEPQAAAPKSIINTSAKRR